MCLPVRRVGSKEEPEKVRQSIYSGLQDFEESTVSVKQCVKESNAKPVKETRSRKVLENTLWEALSQGQRQSNYIQEAGRQVEVGGLGGIESGLGLFLTALH